MCSKRCYYLDDVIHQWYLTRFCFRSNFSSAAPILLLCSVVTINKGADNFKLIFARWTRHLKPVHKYWFGGGRGDICDQQWPGQRVVAPDTLRYKKAWVITDTPTALEETTVA